MKKIISLISAFALASAMMFSVSAELSYTDDVVTLPTEAELKARTPKITLTATPVTTAEEVQAAGISKKQSKSYINADYDTYVVSMTASNLGDLAVGYTDNEYGTKTGVCLPAITLSFDYDKVKDNIKKFKTASSSFSSAMSEGVDGSYLNMVFGSSTDMSYCYPTFDKDDNGQKIENPTVTGNMVFCVTKGKSIDLVTKTTAVAYTYLTGSVANAVILEPSVAKLTLAPAVSGPSYEITDFYDDSADRGYVWDVAVKGMSTDYTAKVKFTAGSETSNEDTIKGLKGIESDGTINFAILLNTPRTIAQNGLSISFTK